VAGCVGCCNQPTRLADNKKLFITGHSKGGSVAHLCCGPVRLWQRRPWIGYHSAHVRRAHPGDQAFADAFSRLVKDVVRYEYGDDLVPHVPPSIMFRHLFKDEKFFEPLMAIDNGVDYAPAGTLKSLTGMASSRVLRPC